MYTECGLLLRTNFDRCVSLYTCTAEQMMLSIKQALLHQLLPDQMLALCPPCSATHLKHSTDSVAPQYDTAGCCMEVQGCSQTACTHARIS